MIMKWMPSISASKKQRSQPSIWQRELLYTMMLMAIFLSTPCLSSLEIRVQALLRFRTDHESIMSTTSKTAVRQTMKITYDHEVDAFYIRFKETTVTTKHVAEGIAADYDADGYLAGI